MAELAKQRCCNEPQKVERLVQNAQPPVLEDNRVGSKMPNQLQSRSTPVDNATIQRTITGINSWQDFVTEYGAENDGEEPSDMLRTSVESIIADETVTYNYQQAFDRAMELAMAEFNDEIVPAEVYVRVSDLIPQLDQTQHRPDLVNYNAETKSVNQTPSSPGQTHYGQSRLDAIVATQNADEVDEAEIAPIFFEILNQSVDAPITTGDGRHRLAVYHAMGVIWIRASITVSQREILEARGIAVQDQPE